MRDLIYKRAAIDAMCDNCDTVNADCAHYPCSRYVAVVELPSAQPQSTMGQQAGTAQSTNDLISRQAAIDALVEHEKSKGHNYSMFVDVVSECAEIVRDVPPEQRWIPVSEGLPKNTKPVNITWVNRKPEPYYAVIKDKPFTATGHYCNGRWWWYSVDCQDYLDEYGECEMDGMDEDIEVIAWMPLPEPYKV